MTTTVLTLVAWSISTAAVTMAAAVAIVFFTYRAPVKGLGAQARSAHYVFRYDTSLDLLGVRSADRKSQTAELRQSIADASADGGVRAALARLGSPKELAQEVAAWRRNPAWGTGSIVAVCVWLAFQFAVMVGLEVLSRGVERLAVPDASIKVSTFFLPGVEYQVTTDHAGAIDVIGTQYNLLIFLVPVLVFFIASRGWRLLSARSARRDAGGTASE